MRSSPQRHAVKFYGTEDSLCQTVADFLNAGLQAGEPALMIARPAHVERIEQRLRDSRVDVEGARRRGDLIALDAAETLGTFMLSGSPDPDLFELHLGTIMDQIVRGRPAAPIRAYGEMVDLLWQQGQTEASVQLEILWNKLALKHAFSLLCGYSMGHFFKQAEQYHGVCAHHTHVLDSSTGWIADDDQRPSPRAE